jgi:hypothetical protein
MEQPVFFLTSIFGGRMAVFIASSKTFFSPSCHIVCVCVCVCVCFVCFVCVCVCVLDCLAEDLLHSLW